MDKEKYLEQFKECYDFLESLNSKRQKDLEYIVRTYEEKKICRLMLISEIAKKLKIRKSLNRIKNLPDQITRCSTIGTDSIMLDSSLLFDFWKHAINSKIDLVIIYDGYCYPYEDAKSLVKFGLLAEEKLEILEQEFFKSAPEIKND